MSYVVLLLLFAASSSSKQTPENSVSIQLNCKYVFVVNIIAIAAAIVYLFYVHNDRTLRFCKECDFNHIILSFIMLVKVLNPPCEVIWKFSHGTGFLSC